MGKKKVLKIFILCLSLIIVIGLIVFGYLHIKNLNIKISNLEEELEKLSSNKTMSKNETDIENSEIYSNDELTELIAQTSSALLGYISIDNSLESTTNTLKQGGYVSDDNEQPIIISLSNNKIKIQIIDNIYIANALIEDNKLICKSAVLIQESNMLKCQPTDVVFSFSIIDDNKLKLEDIKNADDYSSIIGETFTCNN